MKISREVATPLTVAAFGLMAVTGLLMFFHADNGLQKDVHEWLGWGLVAAVGAHVAANFFAFQRHLKTRRVQLILGACALALAGSFFVSGDEEKGPPFAAPVGALAHAEFPLLARVAGVDEAELRARLARGGFTVPGDARSLADVTGKAPRQQLRALNAILKP